MCFMSLKTNVTLPIWYFKTIGSFMISIFHDILDSQVLCASCEDLFFMRIVGAWLYHKFVHAWRVGRFVNPCANPYAMSSLLLSVFPIVLQGLDSRLNPFQEGENDASQVMKMDMLEHTLIPTRGFHVMMVASKGESTFGLCLQFT